MMEVQEEGTAGANLDHRAASVLAQDKRRPYRGTPAHAPPNSTKRQRVSQACSQCHSRKERCDGQHPTCSSCIALKQTCVYGPSQRRRGLPAGYVRVLEMVWGLVFRKVAGSENVVSTLLRRTGENGGDLDWLAIMRRDGEVAETLQETWRKSRVCALIQQLLTLVEEKGDGGQLCDETTARVSRPDPLAIPMALGNLSSSVGTFVLNSGSRDMAPAGELDAPDRDLPIPTSLGGENRVFRQPSPRQSPSSNSVPLPQLPSNCWNLIEIYFNFTHCWFPIVEKGELLRAAYASGKPLYTDDPNFNSGEHAALWAVLTYASAQESALVSESSMIHSDGDSPRPNGEELYLRARSLVPSEDSEFSLGHVQALLLLGLYKLGTGSKTAAWLLVSHAVRLAVAMGIDRPHDKMMYSEAADGVADRSHHALLGCFVLETLISALVARSPCLRSENVSWLDPLREDGLEEWDLWVNTVSPSQKVRHVLPNRRPVHTLCVFNQLVKLSCILNDLLHTSQRNADNIQHYSVYQARVAVWQAQLPEHCQFSATDGLDINKGCLVLPHVQNLRLMYTSTIAMLQIHTLQSLQAPSAKTIELRNLANESANKIIALLKEYIASYGSILMPATIVYYVHLPQLINNCYDSAEAAFKFRFRFHTLLLDMARPWPGVTSTKGMPLQTLDDRGDFLPSRTGSLYSHRPGAGEDQYVAEAYLVGDPNNPILQAPQEITAPHDSSTNTVPEDYLAQPFNSCDPAAEASTAPASHFPDPPINSLTSLQECSIFDQLASLDGTEG